MTSPALTSFNTLVNTRGQTALYHKDEGSQPCLCRTPEGYRDPLWHLENPNAAECNESGFLPSVLQTTVKAFIQPLYGGRTGSRVANARILEMFGDIQIGDHIGIFPLVWNNIVFNFRNWGRSGEDYIEFNGDRYTVVADALIPDPVDGSVGHHWEIQLRLINQAPL